MRPDSPHPLGAKRPSIYSLILDEGAVSFLLSGYPFRTVPRKEGPPRTSSTPWRSRSSFSFPPGLLSFFFFYSISFSSSLLLFFLLLLLRASQRNRRRPDRRKKERKAEKESQNEKEGAETGGVGRKAGGEGGAGGLERTRSPFTLLSGLGRYLSTVRMRTHMCATHTRRVWKDEYAIE